MGRASRRDRREGASMKYTLEDVNPFRHNCGHYPEWVVVEAANGRFETRADAEREAAWLNRASAEAWLAYLRA